MSIVKRLHEIHKNRGLDSLKISAYRIYHDGAYQGKYHMHHSCPELEKDLEKGLRDLPASVELKDLFEEGCLECCTDSILKVSQIQTEYLWQRVTSVLEFDESVTFVEDNYRVEDNAPLNKKFEALTAAAKHKDAADRPWVEPIQRRLYSSLNWHDSKSRIKIEESILESIKKFNLQEWFESLLMRTDLFRNTHSDGFAHLQSVMDGLEDAKRKMLADKQLYPVVMQTAALEKLRKQSTSVNAIEFYLITKLYIKDNSGDFYTAFMVPAPLVYYLKHKIQTEISLMSAAFAGGEPLTVEQFEIFSTLVKERNPKGNELKEVFLQAVEAAKAL